MLITGILQGTPTWVWVLLAGLIALGVVQLRDRDMSRTRLLMLPLAMVVLSLLSTASAFQMAPAAIVAWLGGGTLALAVLGQSSGSPAASPTRAGLYRVAGSWWPLTLILCIFLVRYTVTVALVIDPSLRHQMAFQAGSGLLSGIFSATLLGRAFAVLGINRSRALLSWAVGMVVLALLPLGIALALLAWPTAAANNALAKPSQELEDFMRSAPRTPPAPALYFKARDGADRLYRQYDGAGPDVLVFFHGSTGDSRYLALLAQRMAAQTGLTVVTLDMRGHGPSPLRRGDVDHIEQQEHDIVDLLSHLRDRNFKRVFFGGHSLGAGLAIRYAAGTQLPRPAGLILLAPFVNQASPAAFPGAGGWADAAVPRFIGIGVLHRYHITAFDNLSVVRFRTPPSSHDGTETSDYSWRLWMSVTPRSDWKREIANLECPTLVIGGAEDPFFRSQGYPEVFKLAKDANVQIIPNRSHFHLVVDKDVVDRIAAWMK